MDEFANKLHSIFIYTSFSGLYLSWFDIEINDYSFNTIIYLFLFIQLVIIIRYFNPKMLIEKDHQVKLIKNVTRLSIIILVLNWIFLSFGFAIVFLLATLLNFGFYVFLINQINKQKEREEFTKQFGEGSYSKEDIVQTHILNLFEKDVNINELTRSEIKKQYRTMAKKYHPDVSTEEQKDKFSSINLSYKFLLDLIK